MTEAENPLLQILNWKLPCPRDGLVLVRKRHAKSPLSSCINCTLFWRRTQKMRISRTRLGHHQSVVVRGHEDAETVCMQTSSLEDISSICIFLVSDISRSVAAKPKLVVLFVIDGAMRSVSCGCDHFIFSMVLAGVSHSEILVRPVFFF